MAISNATRLSDFGSGIGTAGAVLKVDNTNDRVGIGTTDPRGMLQVGLAITMNGNTGIASFHTVYGAQLGDSNTSLYGDGSAITGISGFSTALSTSGPKQQIFTTDESMTVSAGQSCYVKATDAAGNIAFTRLGKIHVASGATFQVGSGTTLVMDVLGVFA